MNTDLKDYIGKLEEAILGVSKVRLSLVLLGWGPCLQ